MAKAKDTAPKPGALRAAIYARYSTVKQDKTSLEAQIENCMLLAEREGFVVDERHVFKDPELKGDLLMRERPGATDLLGVLDRGEVDVVLANELERISRKRSEQELFAERLEQRRPKQYFVSWDGIDTRSDNWEIIFAVKGWGAKTERVKIARRVHAALRQRHKDGFSAGGKPYGYTHEQRGDYRAKVIVAAEAEVVRRIFQMYADGMSHRAIAIALNDDDVPSPGKHWKRTNTGPDGKRKDARWMGSAIYTLIRNPIYRGEVVWNRAEFRLYTDYDAERTTRRSHRRDRKDWMVRHDETLRIVPDALWKQCEARMAAVRERNASQKHKGGQRRQRLFNLVCDECGSNYVQINGSELGCQGRRNGGPKVCSNAKRIKLAVANQVLVQELCDREGGLLSDSTLADVRRHMAQHVQKLKRDAAQDNGTTAALRQQLSELDERMENVADSLEKHGYTEVLANRLKRLEQDREAVTHKLKATELGSLDELPDIVPEQLRAYRDKVAALATPNHGLTMQQLVKVRGLIDEIVGPIRVGPDLIARMTMLSYPTQG